MYMISWDDNLDYYRICQQCGGRIHNGDCYILVSTKWTTQRYVCGSCLQYYDIIYGDTFYTTTEGPNRILSRCHSYVFYDLTMARLCSMGNMVKPMACVKI